MAVARRWFVALGRRLVNQGERRQIDSAKKRARTYFQIGWSWLKKQARRQRPVPFILKVYT